MHLAPCNSAGSAIYSSPSRYLVMFHYTGTEERQEVKLTLSSVVCGPRRAQQSLQNCKASEHETVIASYFAFALAMSESTFARCDLH